MSESQAAQVAPLTQSLIVIFNGMSAADARGLEQMPLAVTLPMLRDQALASMRHTWRWIVLLTVLRDDKVPATPDMRALATKLWGLVAQETIVAADATLDLDVLSSVYYPDDWDNIYEAWYNLVINDVRCSKGEDRYMHGVFEVMVLLHACLFHCDRAQIGSFNALGGYNDALSTLDVQPYLELVIKAQEMFMLLLGYGTLTDDHVLHVLNTLLWDLPLEEALSLEGLITEPSKASI